MANDTTIPKVERLEDVPAAITYLINEIAGLKKILEQNSNTNNERPVDGKLYTRRKTADILGISLTTLDTRVKDGTIVASRIGNLVRFTRESIDNALKNIQPAKKIK